MNSEQALREREKNLSITETKSESADYYRPVNSRTLKEGFELFMFMVFYR